MPLLIRTEKNEQKKKNRSERLNGNKAYRFNQKLLSKKQFSSPKEVILIDDILTTGVTVENCCEGLKTTSSFFTSETV